MHFPAPASGLFISPLIFTTVFQMFSLLIAFAHFTNFLFPDCQVLRFCVLVLQVLWIWDSFFCSQVFFTFHSFPTFATVPQVLQIWESFFLLSDIFSFPAFGQFCLEGCRASHWGSKHKRDPSVCLNHTMLSKRY